MSEVKKQTQKSSMICHIRYGDGDIKKTKNDKSSISKRCAIDAVSLHRGKTTTGMAASGKVCHTRAVDGFRVPANNSKKINGNTNAEPVESLKITGKQAKVTTEEPAKEKILESAYKATNKSFKKNRRRKKHSNRLGVAQILLALCCAGACVFAISYLVQANSTDFSMQVAALQVGFEATSPRFIPRGYDLSDITSEDGKITMSFRNSSTGDAFTITEEKSSWDSNALLSNFVEPTYGDNYTVLREQGLTVYVSGSNAAWVNEGIAYKINTTSGSLTKKLILSIATSLTKTS